MADNANVVEHSAEDRIINAIKSDGAKMRSRWFFVFRTALFALVIVILFAALLYLTSFIVFVLRQSGILFAPGFGLDGWMLFLSGLPWTLLLVSLLLIVLLALLLHRYEFVYHHPLFYGLFALVVIIVIGSFWIAATSFHKKVFDYSAQNLPLIGYFYNFETASPSGIHRGEIIAVSQNAFLIIGASGMTSTVVTAPGVTFGRDFQIGDDVIIFGAQEPSGTIEAFGVERTSP